MTDHRAFQIGIRFLGILILILGCVGVYGRITDFYNVLSDPRVVANIFTGPLAFKSWMYFLGPVIEVVIGMYFTLHSEGVANLLPIDDEDLDQEV